MIRNRPTNSGPFLERPYFSKKDIERICEKELRDSSYFPVNPEPVRIERFITKRFGISPIIEALPEGVLGYTTFGQSGVLSMHIASALTEAGTRSSDRLANSTLAHEVGHGLLHTYLFAFASEGLSLFGGDPDVTPTKILCRGPRAKSSTRSYDGQWWELQANMVIGPMLMPRSLVTKAIQPYIHKHGLLELEDIDPLAREEATSFLANVFEVNPAVARIRIEEIYPHRGAQLTL